MSKGHLKWSSYERVVVDILNRKNSQTGGIKSIHWTIYKSISYLLIVLLVIIGNHDNPRSLKSAYGTIFHLV